MSDRALRTVHEQFAGGLGFWDDEDSRRTRAGNGGPGESFSSRRRRGQQDHIMSLI